MHLFELLSCLLENCNNARLFGLTVLMHWACFSQKRDAEIKHSSSTTEPNWTKRMMTFNDSL